MTAEKPGKKTGCLKPRQPVADFTLQNPDPDDAFDGFELRRVRLAVDVGDGIRPAFFRAAVEGGYRAAVERGCDLRLNALGVLMNNTNPFGKFGGQLRGGEVDGIFNLASFQVRDELVGGHHGAIVLALGCRRAKVRNGDDAFGENLLVGREVGDIRGGFAAFKGGDDVGRVDEFAAREVENPHAVFHLGERVGVDKVSRIVVKRRVQRDIVRRGIHFFDIFYNFYGRFQELRVFRRDKRVITDDGHAEVNRGVSPVSAYRGVRSALTEQQRRIGMQGGVVMVGRDIGTVVLPEAQVKVYLDASLHERARRRFVESAERGARVPFAEVVADLANRDRIDSSREVAPLSRAKGAQYLDTTRLDIDQVVARILDLVRGTEEMNDAGA